MYIRVEEVIKIYNYSSLLQYLDNHKARENGKWRNATRHLKLEDLH